MDKLLITNNGGHPFTMDDLDFLQSALTEGIKGAVSPWVTTDPVILSGLTGTNGATHTTYTDGYVIVNNEIYFVFGAVLLNTAEVVIDITVNYNAIGNKLYENGATINCYEKRIGIVKDKTGTGLEVDFVDFILFKNLLKSKYQIVTQDEPSWQALTLSSGWSNGATAPEYRINKIGEVELNGVVENPATTVSNNTICQLPVGFRPASEKAFVIFATVDTTIVGICVRVLTNGNVRIYGTIGTDYNVYLNQIRFSKT